PARRHEVSAPDALLLRGSGPGGRGHHGQRQRRGSAAPRPVPLDRGSGGYGPDAAGEWAGRAGEDPGGGGGGGGESGQSEIEARTPSEAAEQVTGSQPSGQPQAASRKRFLVGSASIQGAFLTDCFSRLTTAYGLRLAAALTANAWTPAS